MLIGLLGLFGLVVASFVTAVVVSAAAVLFLASLERAWRRR